MLRFFIVANSMKTSTVINSNKATATRLAKSIERALQSDWDEVEVIPGVALPAEVAARFIEIAKADDDNASDGDLAFNLQHYVNVAVMDYIAANSGAPVSPRFTT